MSGKRDGFLPIETNLFDRVFISVLAFVVIELLWMRFMESFASLWIATAISAILAQWTVRRG